MLDILIRGMEMPENCFDCPFGEDVDVGVGVAHGCSILKDFAQYANERHRDCPLVEIQTPHGDLIDSDSVVNAQFYDEEHEEWIVKKIAVDDILYRCVTDEMPPVLIPAEEATE